MPIERLEPASAGEQALGPRCPSCWVLVRAYCWGVVHPVDCT
ncbi:hypothetical protein [Streptomyces hirsutus]